MAACKVLAPIDPAETLLGKVVVIVRASSVARLAVYEQLWQVGVKLVIIHPTYLPGHAQFAAHWIEMADMSDVDAIERAIRSAMQSDKFGRADGVPDGICTFDEFAVVDTAVLCQRFGKRPMPLGPEELRATMSKDVFRQWCYDHDVSAPLSVSVARDQVASEVVAAFRFPVSKNNAAKDSNAGGGAAASSNQQEQQQQGQQDEEENCDFLRIEFPLVMKLSCGAGKQQTKLVTNAQELDEHAAIMWRHIDNMAADSRRALTAHGEDFSLLCEEFIGGQEVDLDCIVENGKVVFCSLADNFPTHPPYFCEMGGLYPSELPLDAKVSLMNLLQSWLDSHGTKVHGALHFEAKYDATRSRKSYVIESNCRMGSAEAFAASRAAHFGCEMGEAFIRLALGKTAFRPGAEPEPLIPDAPWNLSKHSCVCASINIMPPEGGGLLAEVRLPNAAERGYVFASTYALGTVLPPVAFACVVWAVAKGATPEEAKANIAAMAEKVEIRCLPAPP